MNGAAATVSALRAPAAGSTRPEALRRHPLLLGVCCLAQFMVILDVSIVNVALPSIHRSLGFSATELQWIVNAYTITFAGFLMLSGRAADLFGHRMTFVTGLLVFSLASLVGGTAVDRDVLIGARALQGLGGAVMAAASLAIITSSFPAGPERHRAIGLWGAMNGAGGATGTLLGGIITQELSWRWILLINLPIGIAAAIAARLIVVERRRERTAASFDLTGALAVTAGLLALVYGIVSAGSHGWGSLDALGPIALGVVLLCAFVLIEARVAEAPLVPLRVFSNRLLRVSNIVVLVFSAALFPMWYFASLYLQEVLRFTPLEAGLAFLPMALTIMVCAMQAGALVARFGVGRVLGTGLSLMAIGLALFGRIAVNGDYISDFLLPGLLVSIGIGFSIVPSTIAATVGATPSEAGLVSGLVNTSRQMGGALGLAILASLAVLYTNHLTNADYRAPILALTDGFRLAFLLGAGFTATGALISFRLIPRLLRPAPALSGDGEAGREGGPAEEGAGPQEPGAPNAKALRVAPPQAPSPIPSAEERQSAPRPAPEPGWRASVQGTPPAQASPPEHPLPAPSRAYPQVPLNAPAARPGGVSYTISGGGRWALAGGSMTIRLARERNSGRPPPEH
ncbi:MAG: DHA2 family efflux MFS transporter permease subunit [Solirubrobacteraceae bacterium]|jgi:EmrB/QacA subfamily drug resistance transporter